MSTSKISNLKTFRAFAFDVFGTLIDDETGVYNALIASPPVQSLSEDHPFRTSRSALLTEFFSISDDIQQKHPKARHLPLAYRAFSEKICPGRDAKTVENEAAKFAETPGTWSAFPDTVAGLQRLSKRYKLVPLTNMDNATFEKVRNGPLAGAHVDAVYTAEMIGSYKPDLRNFDYLFSHLKSDFGVERDQILLVAQSLTHDHVVANKLKMRNCWVDRNTQVGHGLEKLPDLDWVVHSITELADMVDEAWRD
ncbi:MAG: hypothetical protein M1820_000425 [Bogoriella megaspora]|nr:MAG: hypothetical protein M1820_000425 [Bogoriella megaspora]